MARGQDDLRAADAVLTSHVLDMARGRPGSGVEIALYRLTDRGPEELRRVTTNADGRCDEPLLTTADAEVGSYLLAFHAGAYLGAQSGGGSSQTFYDTIPVEFDIADPAGHTHVPLVLAPWGYSTYRGAPPERAPRDADAPKQPATETAPSPEATVPPPSAGNTGQAGLTTHVIDIAQGRGAAGLAVDLYRGGPHADDWQLLSQHRTTPEGRTAAWLVEDGELTQGAYELRFHLGDYFARSESLESSAAFFRTARLRFLVSDPDTHYHVPLLAAPWGYTTYRGS